MMQDDPKTTSPEPTEFSMNRIYQYENYRQFLNDYVVWQKSIQKIFSFRFFAKKAGFNSHSHLEFVLKGQRNFSLEAAEKVAHALGLKGRSFDYFKNMVLYNQSKTVKDKETYFKALQQIRRKISFYKLSEDQYGYYSEWYIPIIRELAVYSNWNGDFKKLARLTQPAISPEAARRAMDHLIKYKFLIKTASGKYKQSNPVISAMDAPEYVTKGAKKEYLMKAIQSLDETERNQRHVASSVLAVDHTTYQEINAMLSDIRKKILDQATNTKSADRIYSLNISLFPLSKSLQE